MASEDGKVIINITDNAAQAAKDFQNLDAQINKFKQSAQSLENSGNFDGLEKTYKNLRTHLKDMAAVGLNGDESFKKLASEAKLLQEQLGITDNSLNKIIETTKKVGRVNNFDNLNQKVSVFEQRLRDLALRGQTDSAGFKNLSAAVKDYKAQIANANNAIAKATGGNSLLSSSLASLSKLLPTVTAGFVALKLKDYALNALNTAAAFEQLGVSFRVMTGSAEVGQQLTDAIVDLAAKTPLTTEALAKNAQTMLSFGESAENIIPNLKMLGDISGGDAQRMQSLTLAFSQVGAAGKLAGQDLMQMVNAGFQPLEEMSKRTGKSMGQLRDEMAQGKIGFNDVKQAMIDATSEGGRYQGLLEAQSNTLNGVLSTNADAWQRVSREIGDFFVPAAKLAVEASNGIADAILNTIKWIESERSTLKNLSFEWEKFWASQRKTKPTLTFSFEPYLDEKRANAIKNTASNLNLTTGNPNTGFGATKFSGSSSGGGSASKHQLDALEQLQKAYNDAIRGQELLALKGITSGEAWDKQALKVNNYKEQLDKIKQAVDSVTQNNGAFADLQKKISDTKNTLLDMAVSGNTGEEFIKLKEVLREYETQVRNANKDVENAVGLSWSSVSSTISSQLSSALTTPLQEGENAFERFGNVALNVIQQIAQTALSNSIGNLLSGSGKDGKSGTSNSLGIFGTIGKAAGGIAGLFKNADGNAFLNGRIVPFANGGVVSSPSTFPMAGNRTGLMGEAGPEAIMPLKRTSNGELGVQAMTQPATINVYNQSGANIETVQRPNGETDIFIKRVNQALRSERTQGGFASALQRNQSRGVQAS